MSRFKQILIITLFLHIYTVKSQIKVFSGGSVTIGGTTSQSGINHLIIGDRMAWAASSASISSAPLIVGQNSVSSSPGFAFQGDHQTGIAHPASSVLGITIANSEKFRFNSSGQILNSNTTSTLSAPDYSWNNDPNTGIFRAGSDLIGFSANGIEGMRLGSSGIMLGTTTMDARITAVGADFAAASFSVTHTNDWWTTISMETNRDNSFNYVVTKSGTLKFYVAGAGWIYSQGNYLGSDKTIKDDIKTIDNACSKISKIRGVTYKLKKEVQSKGASASEYMGVVAQEVEVVAPQAVKTMHDGTKAVSYEMLVGLCIEAIKEQNSKLSQLENDVNNCCSQSGHRGSKPGMQNNPTETGPVIKNASAYNGNSYIKQNNPNPFSRETMIEYYIEEKNAVSSILVFDMNGRLLKTYKLAGQGNGALNISGSELKPGMYFYSLIVNNAEVETKKMILTE
jgi:hypothetical protein